MGERKGGREGEKERLTLTYCEGHWPINKEGWGEEDVTHFQ